MAVKPEDILPDNVNSIQIEGINARKGSVAAALANANILASTTASEEEKLQAKKMIEELAPTLVALKLHEHVMWKNPEIQNIIDEIINQQN